MLVTKQLLIVGFYNKMLNYKDYTKVRNEFSKKMFNKSISDLINSNKQDDLLKGKEVTEIFPILYTESVVD